MKDANFWTDCTVRRYRRVKSGNSGENCKLPRDGDFDLTNFSRSFAQRVQNRKNGKNYEAPANCPELTVEDGRRIRHVVPCLSKSGNGVQMLVTTTFSGR